MWLDQTHRILSRMKLLLGSALVCLVLTGCKEADEPVTINQPAELPVITVQNESGEELRVFTNPHGKVTCPLMNVATAPEKAVGFVDIEGIRYYMCCDGCSNTAKKDEKRVLISAEAITPAFFIDDQPSD
jgi:hypothetical protein